MKPKLFDVHIRVRQVATKCTVDWEFLDLRLVFVGVAVGVLRLLKVINSVQLTPVNDFNLIEDELHTLNSLLGILSLMRILSYFKPLITSERVLCFCACSPYSQF